jgi:2-isopropylmalate synthase
MSQRFQGILRLLRESARGIPRLSPTSRTSRPPRGFGHKAGLHDSAIKAAPNLYQHLGPIEVGNDMRLPVSDMAGNARSSTELRNQNRTLVRLTHIHSTSLQKENPCPTSK